MSDSVSVDGAELHYSIAPSGVDGAPWCLWPTSVGLGPYERMTPPELAEALSIVYVELRASGRSGGEAEELTFDRVAADLDAVRRHLGLGRVALLGHSTLGILAIETARRLPESVSQVVAVGTPPIGDLARVETRARELFETDASDERQRVLAENLSRLPEAPSLGQMLFAQAPRQFHDPRFDPAPYFEAARARPEFFARLFGPLIAGWEGAAALEDLAVPLLLAFGRYDYTVPSTMWDEIAAERPGATLLVFPQSGHYPFFEEGERFVAEVVDWMRSTGDTP